MSTEWSKEQIRFAEERDIPRLLALLRQVNNVHYALRPTLFVPDRTKYLASELQSILRDRLALIFVAEDEQGRAVGYLFAYLRERNGPNLTGGTSFYIDDLCVDAALRGQGIGRALLAFATDYARAQGCRELLLNVWEGNERALRFYTGQGFTPRSRLMEYAL